jgi:chemotaxis protein methyltransferase CheR
MSLEDLSDLTPFKILLRQHTGLDISLSEQDKIKKILQGRLQHLKLDSLVSYCLFLNADWYENQREWQHLIERITIPETFFLRDKGQFRLLKHKLLPDLIARNRHKRSLKIWSAGCSTGEEPYSLALLVQQLLPDYQQWQLLILGSDINQQVLEKARAGVYSHWSLRGVEADFLKHFQVKGDFLYLNDNIKNSVTFQQINLVKDRFPFDGISGMDLILCRNVFIYFTHEAINATLTKFRHSLNEQGYLLTGHGELCQQALHDLDTLNFPESIVYQKL